VEIHPTRMCELLVGLPDVNVLGVSDHPARPLRIHIESRRERPSCRACGSAAEVKDRPEVELVDLPVFGRRARLVWRKHRWRCRQRACPMESWTGEDPSIAAPRLAFDGSGGPVGDRAGGSLGTHGERGR
jgi:transposase